jgi:peptide/nickel transport system substrate-binding protein
MLLSPSFPVTQFIYTMKIKQHDLITVIVLSFILALLPCKAMVPVFAADGTASLDAALPAYGDAFVDSSIGDASTLIPILASDSASHGVAALIYNGLVKYDKDLKLVGDLAESWDILDNGLKIRFHLRKGVLWHDGHPFTAQDVLFTYKTMCDPKTPTAYADPFLQIKDARIIDDLTFEVTYKSPFAPALESWSLSILPEHLLKGRDLVKSELSRHPIGTGPYIFQSWESGAKIVLQSNHKYFEGRPYINTYVYRVIPDSATMFLELQSGTIDRMGLTPLQYQRQTETTYFKSNFAKYRYVSFAYTYLGYNLKNPLFTDKLVRQAISYAIDKQELIDVVLMGLGQIATGPYKPGTWAYNKKVRSYPYDPSKARGLLTKAGWEDHDGDGIIDRNGTPFQFTILTNIGNAQRAKCAEIIQYRLNQIGISVKIRIIEWASFINQFINQRRFEAVILGWTIPQDPDLYDIWHSVKTKPEELNFISYRNTEVDTLLEKARHTFDFNERKKCYFRIQEILAEEQPYTFLFVPDALPIISSRFCGIEPAPIGIDYNFIKWYVPKSEQKYVP